MKAIILAAGMGKRLQEVSGGLPKSMIKLGNSTIVHHQIRSCQQIGISDFVFVLGFKADILRKHILEILPESDVRFVINPIFAETNTLYSLWLTRSLFSDDFVYFNADVIFRSGLLDKISSPSEHSQLLVETKKCGSEEVKVILDENHLIKQISKELNPEACAGEFIGIGKFTAPVQKRFAYLLDQSVKQGQQNNYFEYAVNLLAREFPLEAVSTDGFPCLEIDFPEDLSRAQALFNQ